VWGATILLGVGLVLFDSRAIVGFTGYLSDSLWGTPELPEQVVTYHRFVHGVVGATLTGWGLSMLFVIQHPFRKREPWAWWALLLGPAAWFVLDTGSSLFHGVWPNAILNACSYLPLLIPLPFTRSAFRPTEEAAR